MVHGNLKHVKLETLQLQFYKKFKNGHIRCYNAAGVNNFMLFYFCFRMN